MLNVSKVGKRYVLLIKHIFNSINVTFNLIVIKLSEIIWAVVSTVFFFFKIDTCTSIGTCVNLESHTWVS